KQEFYFWLLDVYPDRINRFITVSNWGEPVKRCAESLFKRAWETKEIPEIATILSSQWRAFIPDDSLARIAANATTQERFQALIEHPRYQSVYETGWISHYLTFEKAEQILKWGKDLPGSRMLGIACISLIHYDEFLIEPA